MEWLIIWAGITAGACLFFFVDNKRTERRREANKRFFDWQISEARSARLRGDYDEALKILSESEETLKQRYMDYRV